jgi:hypothetical protein
MTKTYFITLSTTLIATFGAAQTFEWVNTIGSVNGDLITGIAASNDGFVYVTGNFQDTIDLDNGPGVYPLISSTFSYYEGQFNTTSGDRQLFLAKYTSDGQIVWGKQFGGYYQDFAGIIKLDNTGDIILTGSYYFSIDLNYSDTLNAFGISNAQNSFIAKFSPDGELIWDRRYESGAYLPEYNYDYTNFVINDIAFNDDNSMILCGSTTGQIDTYLNTVFDQNVINNRNTVFYQKLNSNGESEYLKFIKGSPSTFFVSNINAISINQQGDFTLAGNFSDSLFVNPDDPNYFIDLDTLSVLSTYGFFAHYNAAGVFQWSKSIIGGFSLIFRDMVVDAYGNHYMAGEFSQPPNYLDTRPEIDFDPGPGQYNVPTESISSTTSSAFLASYTPTGDFRWAFWMVSPSYITFLNGAVQGNYLEIDASERLVFGGLLNSVIVDIDPGPNVVSLQSDVTGINGSSNPFIARYTTNGNYISHKQFRGAGSCRQTGLSLDSIGAIYSSGHFAGYYKFNFPNSLVTSSTNFTSYNFPMGQFWEAQDAFFTKHQNCIQKSYVHQSICEGDSLLFNGYQLKLAGVYPRILSTLNNCDQIEVLQLEVIPPISTYQNIQLCAGDSIIVDNQILNQSGIYQSTYTASNGCDSLVIRNLSILPLASSTQFVELCFGETWTFNGESYNETGIYENTLTTTTGCDSIVTIHLSILNSSNSQQEVALCAGETYTINGETYSEAGVYSTTFQNSNGCDSTVTTSIVIDEIQVQVLLEEDALTAVNFPTDATLQWVDCANDFSALENETSPVFNPSASGSYAVVVSNGACSATSNCVNYSISGIDQMTDFTVKVFPNPANEILTIESTWKWKYYHLLDNTGRKVMNGAMLLEKTNLPLVQLPAGLYTLQLVDLSGNQKSMKVMKE